jgi:hypothetical protein
MTKIGHANLTVCQYIRHSIVASIPACHAGDRGSIPRVGDCVEHLIFVPQLSLIWHVLVKGHFGKRSLSEFVNGMMLRLINIELRRLW